MTRSPIRCVAIMGATATGKSALAIDLALEFNGEIVSMDSRQVYRGMDIGTGKVSKRARARVPHHLIDILDPDVRGSAGQHAALAEAAVRAIAAKGRVPFLVGGTGLYFRAFFDGLVDVVIPRAELASIRASFHGRATPELLDELRKKDPVRGRALSPNDRYRITRALEIIAYTGVRASDLYARQVRGRSGHDILKLVLTLPRATLRERIAERTRAMFDAGWEDEVRRLYAAGIAANAAAMGSLGYAEIASALARGERGDTALNSVVFKTRQYAKRQETFFRSVKGAVWIDMSNSEFLADAHDRVRMFLASGRVAR